MKLTKEIEPNFIFTGRYTMDRERRKEYKGEWALALPVRYNPRFQETLVGKVTEERSSIIALRLYTSPKSK